MDLTLYMPSKYDNYFEAISMSNAGKIFLVHESNPGKFNTFLLIQTMGIIIENAVHISHLK